MHTSGLEQPNEIMEGVQRQKKSMEEAKKFEFKSNYRLPL